MGEMSLLFTGPVPEDLRDFRNDINYLCHIRLLCAFFLYCWSNVMTVITGENNHILETSNVINYLEYRFDKKIKKIKDLSRHGRMGTVT